MSACDDGTAVKIYSQFADRECLKCHKTFRSTGPGNRICVPCQAENRRLTAGVSTQMIAVKNVVKNLTELYANGGRMNKWCAR